MRLLPAILFALISSSVFGQTYNLSTFVGAVLPANIPGPSASLGGIGGVAVDSAGNVFLTSRIAQGQIYVLSSLNSLLRLDAQTGTLTVVTGNGIPGFSGDNGLAAGASLNEPFGVAVDSAGNVYIADTYNNRIRKVSNGMITTVAGNGTAGFSGDNGPATSAQLSGPSGVAVDSAGNLYIADTGNNRIRKVSNGVITTVAGGGTQLGDNGPATSAQLTLPRGRRRGFLPATCTSRTPATAASARSPTE